MSESDEIKEWAKKAVDRSLGPIGKSAVFLALSPDKMKDDPLPILQMGLAVLLDKPIIILAREGEPIPSNVQKIALEVVRFRDGDWNEGQRRLTEALKRHALSD
jgi:hypothetical protein